MSSTATTELDETIRAILDRATTRTEAAIPDEVLDTLCAESQRNLYGGATREEVYDVLTDVLTARIDRDPSYDDLAANVFLQGYFEEVVGSRPDDENRDEVYRETFVENIRFGVETDLLDERMLIYDLDDLAAELALDRDDLFDYTAVDTLYQRYFLRTADEERLELPQAFLMRVAMGIALREDVADRQERAKEFYHLLSTLRFLFSTPTLFHAGTTHPQLSSCYLTTVEDDLDDIFDSYKAHAKLSKWSGGLGNDWTNIRAAGSLISSTGVESTGTVPFLKISNDVTSAINRSGKRRGAAAAYLACWHIDFPDFLDLKRNTGDERRRTHDMNTAAWVPDLFMKRVEADESWTLFSPDEVPDLHETYGSEFEARYEEYEQLAEEGEIDQFERVEAADLWRTMLTRLFETGHPWITFKDPCNVRSPQDHVGTVHSSNLCTEITLNTSSEETAVCNLGSINLSQHVAADGDGFDREKLAETAETAMRMLDNVVDLNFYPTDRAERSNMRHRPVGLGMMGFHDALVELGVPMASADAVDVASDAAELLAYHAILGSSKLAAERGTYETYAGSKWDRGLLPQDTVDMLEAERGREIPLDRTETLDWERVREHVAEHGMRNSNTMAVAPTATISTIAGTTPSIEPRYSNLYVKSNMSGDFTVVNEHLVSDLEAEGLWDAQMRDLLTYHDGSVADIEAIPEEIRELHRGAFEIDPRHLLHLTAQRAVWIDQSQSHNVFFPSTDGELLNEVYRTAWKLGLKTTYYLRTLGASQIEKSTLDTSEYDDTQFRNSSATDDEDVPDKSPEEVADGGRSCDLPSVEDPTCDACQ
ncbi:ribonucleoside-diphosphate reductase subunit alpha [Haloferax mediterranei ATCC 33500]|uniref:Vitamin B12-dependent ribonucleotide reductase n=2 Tax=Haloferacaceae TaxID=1644056 RepID=I3R0L4_HALMT|nr:ribonucleoside-diphosphate reductase subunit alpha [Haloferax mediterranei]AFK17774.1 ribonucleoside-diphosphate reductase alpha chain [Haloferax mediterranei ATCC 33500]AHZ22795.1 ribonucleotide-diphosphate reductase subunit alpha [Haloferax mediterranei ATCC 33500]EMA02954.1 ribonucleoside-diphosphate reductase subunit alpha [Haloferax mediterranei ATCC 33500]MDX5987864.1 ribonucleoside-diphosphate reductase subunit alpha [Haloferax mediterranei ATCC 33500]QCQ74340.1 ribonucleoside-diphos